MTEKQYENALVALGCKNVTSNTQKKNGTTAFRMPDGVNMITEHKTGYIRRNLYKEDKPRGLKVKQGTRNQYEYTNTSKRVGSCIRTKKFIRSRNI